MVPLKLNWEVNISTVIQILVVIGGLLVAYGQFESKFEDVTHTLMETQKQTTRIERYLSSQDKEYWQKVNSYGDR